jgi:hypothetical protein
MKIIALASALALLLEPSAAFYPYTFPDAVPTETKRSSRIEQRSLTVPLQRVRIKRNNAFRIIYAQGTTGATTAGINQDGADLSYMVSLQFGSTKKAMNMLLDSAAINMWVMSSTCTTAVCAVHNTFGGSDSTTLQVCPSSFQ